MPYDMNLLSYLDPEFYKSIIDKTSEKIKLLILQIVHKNILLNNYSNF